MPAAVAKAATDAKGTGITVRTYASRFSAAELDAESRRLFDLPSSALGGKVQVAAPLPDASGVELTLAASGGAAAMSAARTVLQANPIPVRVKSGSAPSPAYNRWEDTQPFFGGGVIWTGTGTLCTAGFAARTATNAQVMITAHHCGTNTNWFTPIHQLYVGHSNGGNLGLDAMTIADTYYDGGVYSASFDSPSAVAIKGRMTPIPGDVACPSGGFSGNDCRTTIQQAGIYFELEGSRRGPAFTTLHDGGVASVGQGDSGGPVIGYDYNTGGFKALGIISAIATDDDYTGTCQGYDDGNRTCSSYAFHMDINAIASQFGLTIAIL